MNRKKCIVYLSILTVVLVFSIINTTDTSAASKSKLKSVVRKTTSEKIRKIYYKDFDNNGKTEAVAITSSQKGDFGYVMGKVWYVKGKKCNYLGESNLEIYARTIRLCKVKNGYILFFENGAGGSSTISSAYFIGKSGARQLDNIYSEIKYHGKNKFTQVDSNYDGMFDSYSNMMCIHTYKQYWFYWNGKEIVEYGGIPITKKQLKKAKGSIYVLKRIRKEKGTILSIYYRSNNIVNITYKVGKRDYYYYNITMKLSKGKLNYCQVNDYGKNAFDKAKDMGIYIGALSPKAKYPKKFRC